MKGGVFAESSSSGPGGRGDEVAVSGCPGTRLPPSAWYRVRIQQTHLEQPLDIKEGSQEPSGDALSDLVVSTYSCYRIYTLRHRGGGTAVL